MKNRNNRHLSTVLITALAATFALGLTGCQKVEDQAPQPVEEVEDLPETQSQAVTNTIEYKGKTYRYNQDLNNILFLGIDKTEHTDTTFAPGEAGQSDCIMLVALDTATKEAHILQINRNAMTQIDVYDKNGNYLDSMDGQLALQYAYNIGGESSCWATKKTVEELLYGLEIDGYFSMEMAGIPEINDALGGVDVLMEQDYTAIDPTFVEGETVHLSGDAAESFVHSRDCAEFNSVQNRMERQVDYITAMIDSMHSKGGEKLYDVLSPFLDQYIITDLDADHLNALTTYTYLTDEVAYLPGEMQMGDVYEEYYVDQDALQDLLISIFYTEVE